MSSSSAIPNLLSLRGSSGVRGRGRGRGQRSRPGDRAAGLASEDHGRATGDAAAQAIIQGTDTDAAVSRLSAVRVGLLEDPFAECFVQSGPGQGARRLPVINRGTYTRTTGLDILVDAFLSGAGLPGSTSAARQIISLGAGTDTRSLRLFSRSSLRGITYHEIDFPIICAKKLNIIKSNPVLSQFLSEPSLDESGSWSVTTEKDCQLWCHGRDLRDLSGAHGNPATLFPGLRNDIPTLLISECCLCYLETDTAAEVIKWFTERVPEIGIIIYEPTNPGDAFGRTMIENLASRKISMPTLFAYSRPKDQVTRLQAAGFEEARYLTIDQVWDAWVSDQEKERVNGCEGLDEVEEWKLLASHYILAWGWRGPEFQPWTEV